MYQLQRLNHVHMAMVESVLDGMSAEDIARCTRRSVEGVRIIINSAMFQAELSRRRTERNREKDTVAATNYAKAQKILEDNLVRAAEKQVSLLESLDQSVQQKAIDAIWNRTFGAKERSLTPTIQIAASSNVLLNLHIALAESRGDIIDPETIDGELSPTLVVKSLEEKLSVVPTEGNGSNLSLSQTGQTGPFLDVSDLNDL